MEMMNNHQEIKIFIYDKLLNPYLFEKTFKLKVKHFIPCFAFIKLCKNHYNYFGLEEGFSRDTKITFGTLYTIELSQEELNDIVFHFTANGMLRKDTIKVSTIKFHSIEDFVSQKFEVINRVSCYCFVSEMRNKKMLSLAQDRHRECGSFHKIFLQTYH